MKNISINKAISMFLSVIIILALILILFNISYGYNNLIIIGVTLLSTIVLVLNLFVKNKIIEKEIIVEKELFIETSEIKKEKIQKNVKNEDFISIIDKKNKDIDLEKYINKQLSKIANYFSLDQIVFYLKNNEKIFTIVAKYAFISEKIIEFKEGEGLSGQVVKDKKPLYLTDIPIGYITVISGLGKGDPKSLLIIPVIMGNDVIGLAEFASLRDINETDRKSINLLIEKIAENLINVY
jgi:transcriptional regulator with GAF, ATPase, and Fis domain